MMIRCRLVNWLKSNMIWAKLRTLSSTDTNFLSTTWIPYEEGSDTCS